MNFQMSRRFAQVALTSAAACVAWWALTSYYGIESVLGNYIVAALAGATLAVFLRIFNIWK